MQELTKAQQEYFKNTKMRDKKGSLLVCYHCTAHDFDAFDKSKIGVGNDVGFLGRGFYFTTDTNYSNEYGSNKYECYINMKNPFIISDLDSNNFADYLQIVEIMEYLQENHPEYGEPGGPKELVLEMDDDPDTLSPSDFNKETFLLGFWQEYSQQITDYARENGYDGIIVDPPSAGDVFEIVVFEPNQIKLTTNLYPTKSDNFKDNSKEYLNQHLKDMTVEECCKLSKHISDMEKQKKTKEVEKENTKVSKEER